jgi:beta-lactamase regulating signal transducer with metallopeptidase domain
MLVTSNWEWLARHVVESTVIALVLLGLSLVPRLESRTRHALLLVALAKFFVPLAALARLLGKIGIDVTRLAPFVSPSSGSGWIAMAMSSGGAAESRGGSELHCASVVIWALVAAALLARWAVSSARVRALRASLEAAGSREIAQLERLATSSASRRVRIARSALVSSPCVAGSSRPVIILPAAADLLDDDELRMLLAHELEHVRRRDALLLSLQPVAGALLWFHPLAWILTRSLRIASESACDEAVLATGVSSDDYLEAMLKTCRLPSPGALELPAMAESHLGERMKTMSRFDSRFRSSIAHSLLLTLSLLAIVASAIVLGAPRTVAAQSAPAPKAGDEILSAGLVTTEERIVFTKVLKLPDGSIKAVTEVRDRKTGKTISAPSIITRPGEGATVRSGTQTDDGHSQEFRLEFLADATGLGVVWCRFFRDDVVVEDLRMTLVPRGVAGAKAEGGEPIDLSLKDAKLTDVLATMGQLTGLRIDTPAGLSGSVTLELTRTPWPVALDRILDGSGYTWQRDGNTIVIVAE